MARTKVERNPTTLPRHWTLKKAQAMLRPAIKQWFPHAKGGLPPTRAVLVAAIQEGLVQAHPEKGCWNVVPASMREFVKSARGKQGEKMVLTLARTPIVSRVRRRHLEVEAARSASSNGGLGTVVDFDQSPATKEQIERHLRQLEQQAKEKVLESAQLLFDSQKELNRVRSLIRMI